MKIVVNTNAEIKKMISEDRLKDAIELYRSSHSGYKGLNLSRRINSLEAKKHSGLISPYDYEVEKNKISMDLFYLLEANNTSKSIKNSKSKKLQAVILFVVFLLTGVVVILELSNTSLFNQRDEETLKIAILPLKPSINRDGITMDITESIIEFVETKSEQENLKLQAKLVIVKEINYPRTVTQAKALGSKINADLIIWGNFEEGKDAPQGARIRYALTKEFDAYVDSSKKSGDTNMIPLTSLDEIREGFLLEDIDYIINWCIGMQAYKIQDLKTALVQFEKIESINHENEYKTETYNRLGNINFALAKYDKAEIYYQKSIDAQELGKSANWRDLAYTYIGLSGAQTILGKFDLGVTNIETALEILSEHKDTTSKYTAAAYSDLGMLYREKGDSKMAKVYFQRSMKLFMAHSETNYRGLATVQYNLGVINLEKGRVDPGIDTLKMAAQSLKEGGNPDYILLAKIFSSLGNSYSNKRQLPDALSYHNKAIAILESRLAPYHPYLAGFYSNIGEVYMGQDSLKTAKRYFERANEIYEHNNDSLSKYYAYNLINLGQIHAKSGRFQKGISLNKKADYILLKQNKGKVHWPNGIAYINIGNAYQELDDYSNSRMFLDSALTILIKELGSEDTFTGYCRFARAKLFKKLRIKSKALLEVSLAVKILSSKLFEDARELKDALRLKEEIEEWSQSKSLSLKQNE